MAQRPPASARPDPQLPAPKQETLAVETFSIINGMNTQEERSALTPGFWSWLMNIQPIGKRTLRFLNGRSATLYTLAGDVITNTVPYTIGSTLYRVLFTLAGAAYQINLTTGAATTIGVAGTFYNGTGQYPHAVAWGNKGILIISTQGANSYWAWDGTTLYSPGGAVPTWLGTLSATMPTGISGTAIEIYQSTVWLVNGRTIFASAPADGTSFATASGGVNVTVNDAYVQQGYFGIKQLDGFLYLFASGACDVISDVQTTGSPPTTTFLRVNVSPLIGSPWRDSVIGLPSSVAFANLKGVYEVSGGQTRKVSDLFDGIFEEAKYPAASQDVTGYHPSAATITLDETICYCLTISLPDPDDATNTFVPCLAIWDGKRWFLGSQELPVTIISGTDADQLPWASNGTDLFQAFTTPSSTLTKKAKSWYSAGDAGITMRKQIQRIYTQLGNPLNVAAPLGTFTIDTESGEFAGPSLSGAIQWVNNAGHVVTWTNNLSQTVSWTGNALIFAGNTAIIALMFGVTVTSTTATLDIIGLYCGYVNYSRYQ